MAVFGPDAGDDWTLSARGDIINDDVILADFMEHTPLWVEGDYAYEAMTMELAVLDVGEDVTGIAREPGRCSTVPDNNFTHLLGSPNARALTLHRSPFLFFQPTGQNTRLTRNCSRLHET